MTANIDDNLKQNFDHAGGHFVLTDKDGNVVYTNEAVKSKTGFSVGEAVGKRPGELWGGVMPADYYDRFWHTIGTDARPFADAVNNQTKFGENYQDQLLAAPILDSTGTAQYYFQFSPDSSQVSSAEQLIAEFSAVFAKQKTDPGLALDFINKWLALKENELKNYYAAQAQEHDNKLVELFRHILVAPTALGLLNRSDDRVLIIAAQQNKDQFAKLYIKYHDQIYDYFYHRVGFDGALADDLAQETFVSAFKSLSGFKVGNSSYLTYLLRVAHNNLVNYYRKMRVISLEANPEIRENLCATPACRAEVSETEEVWRAARELSLLEQQILQMKYKNELSVKEIADNIKKSENAVKLYLSRARKKLRGLLE